MLRFHRTSYEWHGHQVKSTWFQLGDRIFRHRMRLL